jgi:hypothetical protein
LLQINNINPLFNNEVNPIKKFKNSSTHSIE